MAVSPHVISVVGRFVVKSKRILIMRKLRIKRFVFRLASFASKIALSLLTFLVGVASAILLSEISPPTVTLCQLAQNPSLYDGRIIRIEADGRGGIFSRSMLIEDTTCQLPDAWSSVSLVESVEPSAEAQQLFMESDSDYFKARVVVTGRFDPNTSLGCFAPKFGIKTTSVELKSAITTEPMPKRTQE